MCASTSLATVVKSYAISQSWSSICHGIVNVAACKRTFEFVIQLLMHVQCSIQLSFITAYNVTEFSYQHSMTRPCLCELGLAGELGLTHARLGDRTFPPKKFNFSCFQQLRKRKCHHQHMAKQMFSTVMYSTHMEDLVCF